MAQIMSMKINTRNSEEPTLALLLKRHNRKVVRTIQSIVNGNIDAQSTYPTKKKNPSHLTWIFL